MTTHFTAKAAPPQPHRKTYQPASQRMGNLSNPPSTKPCHPSQRAYINKLLTQPWRVDFLDLPHSGPGTPPGSASPLKPVKHFLVYLVVFYLTFGTQHGARGEGPSR